MKKNLKFFIVIICVGIAVLFQPENKPTTFRKQLEQQDDNTR